MALAAVLAQRGRLEIAAVLLGATEDWPGPVSGRLRGPRPRGSSAGSGSTRSPLRSRGRALDLEGAKALARAAI